MNEEIRDFESDVKSSNVGSGDFGGPRRGNVQSIGSAVLGGSSIVSDKLANQRLGDSNVRSNITDSSIVSDFRNGNAGDFLVGVEDMNEADDRESVPVTSSGDRHFYNINIEALTSGFILSVGCQRIAVENAETLTKLIHIYLTDSEAQSRWYATENRNIQKFIEKSLEDNKQ